MGSDSLFLKDPASSRFLSGGLGEAEALLGSPLPGLPLPDVEGGRLVYHVKFHPQLRTLVMRYLQSLLRDIGAELPGAPRGNGAGKEALEHEVTLERVLRSVRIADRRGGLGRPWRPGPRPRVGGGPPPRAGAAPPPAHSAHPPRPAPRP